MLLTKNNIKEELNYDPITIVNVDEIKEMLVKIDLNDVMKST